jgi:hypothetical protein
LSDCPWKVRRVFTIALRSLSRRVVALDVHLPGVMFPQIGAPPAGTLYKVVRQFASFEEERSEPIQADLGLLVVENVVMRENHASSPFGPTSGIWSKVSHC